MEEPQEHQLDPETYSDPAKAAADHALHGREAELIEQAGGFALKEGAEIKGDEVDPHHALNNPVEEPDPTEYPDPYTKEDDPLGPDKLKTVVDGEEDYKDPALTSGAISDSEPHPFDHDDLSHRGMGRSRSGDERQRDQNRGKDQRL